MGIFGLFMSLDLPPINSARVKLVKSALGRRSGHEEEVYGRADSGVFEAG